jgi:hypothetical protein
MVFVPASFGYINVNDPQSSCSFENVDLAKIVPV